MPRSQEQITLPETLNEPVLPLLQSAFKIPKGGCIIPLFLMPEGDDKTGRTFEEIAAHAGQLIAAAEDSSRKAKKHADGYNGGGGTTEDNKRKDLEKEIRGALDDARKAKNEAYGAACAGKKAKDVRGDIEAAEKSFDNAEDLLDKTPLTNTNLKNAAKEIFDDVKHLKDAMDKVTD